MYLNTVLSLSTEYFFINGAFLKFDPLKQLMFQSGKTACEISLTNKHN